VIRDVKVGEIPPCNLTREELANLIIEHVMTCYPHSRSLLAHLLNCSDADELRTLAHKNQPMRRFVSQTHTSQSLFIIPSKIMQPKLSVLSCLTLVLASAQALILDTPANVTAGEPLQISWQPQAGDTKFSLELLSITEHDSFTIANNVNPAELEILLTIPCVPIERCVLITAKLPISY
jgi:hypothetical protein